MYNIFNDVFQKCEISRFVKIRGIKFLIRYYRFPLNCVSKMLTTSYTHHLCGVYVATHEMSMSLSNWLATVFLISLLYRFWLIKQTRPISVFIIPVNQNVSMNLIYIHLNSPWLLTRPHRISIKAFSKKNIFIHLRCIPINKRFLEYYIIKEHIHSHESVHK